MIKQLSDEYLALWNDYRRYYRRLLPRTTHFQEEIQSKDDLSTRLSPTYIDMEEVLPTSNDSEGFNQRMDEMKDEWTKDQHSNQLENRLKSARELLDQFELNYHRTSSDNQHFFSQFKVYLIHLPRKSSLSVFLQECEEELNTFQTTSNDQTNRQQQQLPHSLVDELTTVRASSFFSPPPGICIILLSSQLAASITRARIQLENQIAFSLELDSFYNWLNKFTKKGKHFDQQVR